MPKVMKIETALRCLLACAIFASPLLPAQAQQVQTSGPQQDVTTTPAPLFVQPNYEGDLRQHCFFAGSYTNPVQISVGTDDEPLFWWQCPTIQTVYPGPTPISTGLIGDNIDTTVQNSVPGLVNAAVTGAVVGASALGGAVSNFGAGAAGNSASIGGAGASQSVNGTVLDGTQF